ncbi:MAG: hypothetical protein ACRDSK_31095 [Actinophytocola sp.]
MAPLAEDIRGDLPDEVTDPVRAPGRSTVDGPGVALDWCHETFVDLGLLD